METQHEKTPPPLCGNRQRNQSTPHHAVAEVEAHNHLLEDPARLVLRQPVVQAALAQEAVQLRISGKGEGQVLGWVEKGLC